MNKLVYLIPLAALTLALGCTPTEKKTDVPQPPKAPQEQTSALAPATAMPAPAPAQPESSKQIVQGYAKSITGTMDRARLAQTRVDMEVIQAAVRNYQVDNGKYPASLDEVKGSLRAGADLSLFNYDSATGMVSIK